MDFRLTGLDWKTSLSAVTDLILPRECIVCSTRLLPYEKHICMECLADLPLTHYETLERNPMADRLNALLDTEHYEPYAYAAALFHYKSEAGYRKIPQALKYHRNFGCGEYFATLLAEKLKSSPLFSDVDLVVGVPLHWTRRLKRGYNQAEVIASTVARVLGCRCDSRLLVRNRRTGTQTRVSVEKKRENVRGAFSVKKSWKPDLEVKHILIVDDVFTTGATISECFLAIRSRFGPKVRVSIATIAVVGGQNLK